jgi:ferritin-like protein
MATRKGTVSSTSGVARPDYKIIQRGNKSFADEFRKAMYYVHYEIAVNKLKTETIKYAKHHHPELTELDILENYYYNVIGKPCYIINQGGQVPAEWEDYITTELVKLNLLGIEQKLAKANEKEAKETKVATAVTIQDRLKEQAAKVSAIFDGWVDDYITNPRTFKPDSYDPYTEMQSADLKAQHVRHIVNFYESDINELKNVIKKSDEYLSEAYDTYTMAQVKKLLKLYEKITDAANLIIESAKSQRAPRQRVVSSEKKVAKLKYMQTFPMLGLSSQNPVDIVGAQELWVYNTKTRKLGKYIALDAAGLDVKGTSVIGFASKDSVEKTLRKPELQLKEFKSAGKVVLRKFLSEINAVDIPLNGRINENIILLKVQK